ncbi:MAG: hypothetical protein PHQ12_14880, partial [Chthoniobacteraceae bacterium]|nr:hypothetical protein [Chthoniobacteraceae bacterium]
MKTQNPRPQSPNHSARKISTSRGKTAGNRSHPLSSLAVSLLSASALLASVQSGQAVSATWAASASGNWNAGGNWSTGSAPGLGGTGANSTDTATFNLNNTGVTTVSVDTSRDIGNITFDTDASSYTFSGGPLWLTVGAKIQMTAAMTGHNVTEKFTAPITLWDGGGQTFTNNSTDATNIFQFGSVNASQNNGLVLNGSNTGNNAINGAITSSVGNLTVTKDGTGTWALTGSNTY